MKDKKKEAIAKIRCIVIHPNLVSQSKGLRAPAEKLQEAIGLANALNLEVIESFLINLKERRPSTYLGKGKVEELGHFVKENFIELAILDCHLAPIQQRNLERDLKCKVIDRTALIIQIFASRARTAEGKLQVELASLEYQKTRLVRMWTHLERQRGGFGFLAGPGESQLEIDSRIISERIFKIKNELKDVKRTRALHRKNRSSVPYPIVAFVGYTNAGKSTLFNRLTNAKVVAEDKLFATLDPTMRMITLPSKRKIIVSDTVGFISELPTQLVAAFRATLEEVIEADIILHIRDISTVASEAEKQDVEKVLDSLGIHEKMAQNMVEVLNKIDLLSKIEGDNLIMNSDHKDYVAVSAITGQGCDYLLKVIDKKLAGKQPRHKITISASDGKLIAWIYEHGETVSHTIKASKMTLEFSMSEKNFARLEKLKP